MTYLRLVHSPALLTQAQTALGLTQETLGDLLGVSRRTMTRWQGGGHHPSIQQWADLARHVYRVKPALAQAIASEMGETLVSLGLVAPPAPPQPAPVAPAAPSRPEAPTVALVDSIVCAAAEAVASTPQSMRPALLAAFERAAVVHLSIDDIRAALRPRPAT
jgi:DNA-binding XRE family transcriptional regulator